MTNSRRLHKYWIDRSILLVRRKTNAWWSVLRSPFGISWSVLIWLNLCLLILVWKLAGITRCRRILYCVLTSRRKSVGIVTILDAEALRDTHKSWCFQTPRHPKQLTTRIQKSGHQIPDVPLLIFSRFITAPFSDYYLVLACVNRQFYIFDGWPIVHAVQ